VPNHKATHTTFYRGKRVFIAFRDGTTVVDRYIDRNRDCVILEELGKVKIKTIRSIGIYKEKGHEQGQQIER
jgi:hypothetical protein